MKKLFFNLLLLLFIMTTAYSADAVDVEALLKQANTAFSAGTEIVNDNPDGAEKEYRRASLLFSKIIDSGVENEKVYYNLGNCYYRLGDFARAILAYRRGLQYDSGNKMLLNNLSVAREKAGLKVEEEQSSLTASLLAYQDSVAISYKEYVFYVSYSLFWIFLLAMLLLKKRSNRKIFLPLMFLWIISLGAIVAYSYSCNNSRLGVVTGERVMGRKGDGDNYAAVFTEPLKAGVEFQLLEKRGDWSHIELADGAECWVKNQGIGLVCEKD